MNSTRFGKRLAFGLIFINYLLEFLYTGARLIGVQLWLEPIDLETEQGLISYELYIFEGIFVAQLFLIWVVVWQKGWQLKVKRAWHISILSILSIILVITVICVFTWNAGWPGMLERRLFAYESWVLITALSVYVQGTYINYKV